MSLLRAPAATGTAPRLVRQKGNCQGGLTDGHEVGGPGSGWPPTHGWSHQGWGGGHAAATSGWDGTALCMPAGPCREARRPSSLLVALAPDLVGVANLILHACRGACTLAARDGAGVAGASGPEVGRWPLSPPRT